MPAMPAAVEAVEDGGVLGHGHAAARPCRGRRSRCPRRRDRRRASSPRETVKSARSSTSGSTRRWSGRDAARPGPSIAARCGRGSWPSAASPCGPAKSTSLRAASAGVSRSRASSSISAQRSLGDRRELAQEVVHRPLPSGCRCRASCARRRRAAAAAPSPSPPPRPPRRARRCRRPGTASPAAISRHIGVRRSRNSRSMQKCLNSSPCASAMIARASRSGSTARRCSYQPIASASSVSEVHSRAKVRVSAESSSGGSWYWSVGIPGSCHLAPFLTRSAARAPAPPQLGIDVVVVVEDVLRVDAALDLEQPLVVRPVGGAHRVVALVVAEVVDPARLAEVRAERAVRLARPGDVLVRRGRVRPDRREDEVPALGAMGHGGVRHAHARDRAVEVLEQHRGHRRRHGREALDHGVDQPVA